LVRSLTVWASSSSIPDVSEDSLCSEEAALVSVDTDDSAEETDAVVEEDAADDADSEGIYKDNTIKAQSKIAAIGFFIPSS